MMSVLLETRRLRLRPMELHDVPFICAILNRREITDNMADYPHPFPPAAARDMIVWSQRAPDVGRGYSWAITQARDLTFIGAVFLRFHVYPAELGYWLGVPYWGQGLATEAADVVLRYAFETLRLPRIAAYAYTDNAGSRRVLNKLGMRLQHVRPGMGGRKAAAYYAISGAEWQSHSSQRTS